MPTMRFIEYRVADGLARLVIARAPHNVLDIETMREMNTALDECLDDDRVKLLLISGAGDKAFSAGVEVADHTPDKVEAMLGAFHGMFRRLWRLSVPTLAAVRGAALGGGMELAIACDMRVAAADARFAQPEIRLGVFPPVAAVLLPRLLPQARAMEMLLGGGSLGADDALRFGLVNRVFPVEGFDAAVDDFVAAFTKLSRAALVHTRKAIRVASEPDLDAALARAERVYLDELMASEDAREGLAAFLEKRKPVWRDR